MAYKRNLSLPLSPTFEDPKKPKKTIKERISTIQSNRAIDAADKKKRKAEIQRQYNESKSGLARNKTYSVDVSGERKIKKKVIKIQEKIDKVSDEKDARQRKAVEAGRRVETRKNQLLQKQVKTQRVENGKSESWKEKKERPDNPPRTKKKKTGKLGGLKGKYKKKGGGSEESSCKDSMKSKKRKECKVNV